MPQRLRVYPARRGSRFDLPVIPQNITQHQFLLIKTHSHYQRTAHIGFCENDAIDEVPTT